MSEADFSEYLKNPLLFPDAFKSWISDYFATNLPKIPISQVYGFKVHSVKSADATLSSYSTSSLSFVDVSAPALANIPNGFYIIFFGGGFAMTGAAGTIWQVGLSLDTAAPTTNNIATFYRAVEGVYCTGGRVVLVDFSQGTGAHSIKLYGKTNNATYPFEIRQPFLHALKVVTE